MMGESNANLNADWYIRQPWRESWPVAWKTNAGRDERTMLDLFRHAVATKGGEIALSFFDMQMPWAELDSLSDAFGLWLRRNGMKSGDRIAIILQNAPQFPIACLGAWKAAMVPVPMNPMYKGEELQALFSDCAPTAILCEPNHRDVVGGAATRVGLSPFVLTCAPYPSRQGVEASDASRCEFSESLRAFEGLPPEPVAPGAERELALLMYTSGTTGRPKGAMLSHAALSFNTETSTRCFGIKDQAVILAIAPLFHITGFVLHFAAWIATRGRLVLTDRFEASSVLEALLKHRPHFTIGAITAFIALLNEPKGTAEHFRSLESVYSGGAPIPPSIVTAFKQRYGVSIHPAYGMTETCAPTTVSPLGIPQPVDSNSGALTIGLPMPGVEARILMDNGVPAGIREAGELLLRGPQLMTGYWRQPEATANAFEDGWLRSGDVALMDENGWFFIVDRKKDVIIASGFKVWPREIEDVLYRFDGVREAAVIGKADDYRGETVLAYVSLKSGHINVEAEILAFCRQRLAAYKCPREVIVLSELPKTASGKLMRQALRSELVGARVARDANKGKPDATAS
jgi:long-chain acyl-CoA synthetase